MTGNTSSAVRQQRRDRAKASLDDFPTPPWATRALLRVILQAYGRAGAAIALRDLVAADPCCNRGHMVRPLLEVFGRVLATDIHDYGADPRVARILSPKPGMQAPFEPDGVADFLLPSYESAFPRAQAIDWFVLNPPYKAAAEFIIKALRLVRPGGGVAAFVRTSFVEGHGRYEDLFRETPPTLIAWFTERVALLEGVLRDPDREFWNPHAKGGPAWQKPSSATSYCWMLWIPDIARQPDIWIPPSRRRLTRPGDYPVNADERGVYVPQGDARQGQIL